ncbi:hypothetical protein [Vibrio diabolicus]|uniref:hypothetical protein n=1 Tax=Vibrio diabolicus TaxID=50719 RepID=UPI0038CD2FDB
MSPEYLNSCINSFISLLNQNFEMVVESYSAHKLKSEKHGYVLVSFDDYFGDWAQANWELLVERVICSPNESLVIYGSGSDYEAAAHSRVFFQEAKATHEIICNSSYAIDWISKSEVDLSKFDFESFVSRSGEWFDVCPPFDHVLFTEKGAVGGDYLQVVIPRNQLEFSAQAIEI